MRAIAEAPSKAIVTGEHFVVHGAWALAAALPRKVKVTVETSDRFEVRSDRFGKDAPQLDPVVNLARNLSKGFSVGRRLAIDISSEIPEGAGLGSSASTMVALVAAIARLASARTSLSRIAGLSMEGEKGIHGRPSGIDPAICTRGGVILFRRGSRPVNVKLSGPMSLLVAYSGERRSTRHQIGLVSAAREKHPAFFAGLQESVSELSLMAAEKLSSGDRRGLGGLMNFNQAVLGALGVSTPKIDEIVDFIRSEGGFGAKLTGAGGGGSVVGVATEAKEKSIVSGLQARGFEAFRAQLPVEGVRSWLEQ